MDLGSAIKLCRSRRGMSQVDLARRAECSVSYLSMLENGLRDPALSTIKKLAEALRVPVQILFFLAAGRDDLSGIDKDLAGQLARLALELLNEPVHEPDLL